MIFWFSPALAHFGPNLCNSEQCWPQVAQIWSLSAKFRPRLGQRVGGEFDQTWQLAEQNELEPITTRMHGSLSAAWGARASGARFRPCSLGAISRCMHKSNMRRSM